MNTKQEPRVNGMTANEWLKRYGDFGDCKPDDIDQDWENETTIITVGSTTVKISCGEFV